MDQWEYRLYSRPNKPDADVESDLNALGNEGWKFDGLINGGLTLLFKRPKVSDARIEAGEILQGIAADIRARKSAA